MEFFPMLENYSDYLIQRYNSGYTHYPGPLQKYLADTKLEELISFFVVQNNFRGSQQLYLSKKGQVEVENYISMSQRPRLKIPFSRYAKEFSMIPYMVEEESKRILISNYKEAVKEQVEFAYFDKQDYLGLILFSYKDVTSYEFKYSGDYEEYVVETTSKEVIARNYLNWIESNMERRESELTYDVDTYQMAYKSMTQRAEYTAIIEEYDDIIIPSDGLGVFSAMCILAGKRYYSWEPNIIGERARKLGIIHSTEMIYEDKLYVFFYCVQYYSLPFFPKQRFLVIDVPTIKKPGFQLSLYASSSIRDQTINYYFPPDPMALQSCYCIDVVAANVTSVMKVEKKTAVNCQFIVASTISSIETSIQSGFYSKEYWKNVFNSMKRKEQNHHMTYERLYTHIREKTLLLFDRSFPFRRGGKSRWKVENNIVKKEYGPGWYFMGNVMWYGEIVDDRSIRSDYSYDSGYFIFKDSSRPQNIVTVRLHATLEEIYGSHVLKLFLVSTYKVGGLSYITYVPESKILKKAVLIDET